jgi:hypothetical protein
MFVILILFPDRCAKRFLKARKRGERGEVKREREMSLCMRQRLEPWFTPPDDRKTLSPILVCIARHLAVADRVGDSPAGKIRPFAKIWANGSSASYDTTRARARR